MGSDHKQRKLFSFLKKHFSALSHFTLEELQEASGWQKAGTFKTYLSKQFGSLIAKNADDTYRVTEAFRRYSKWELFRELVSQVRRTNSATYKLTTHQNPVIFEFYLPLANEVHLREALDSLFYRETIMARLRSRTIQDLRVYWPGTKKPEGEYLEELCSWLGSKLVGYSIGQVDGRYRVGDLITQTASSALIADGGKYLIDEITAIVRFIFPIDKNEVDAIRYFFELIFVSAIIEVTDKEAEIWMVESGAHTSLRIWSLVE